jgi:dUTP pyrophosphatase
MIKTIKFTKLSPKAIAPFRKNPTDAGIDFYSSEYVTINPNSIIIVHTGISIEIPEGFMLLIKPKGRNNHLIGAGVADAYYEPGEILIKIANITNEYQIVCEGEAIAQGIYIPIETPQLIEVEKSELINNKKRSGSGGIVNQV